jgi:AcrR family transcriptional regulator
MAIKKTDREALLDAALTLFRTQGYHNTSMADIGKASGLLKGSIYHYFPGKKELAVAALDRVIEEVREKLFKYADDGETPAEERLEALAEAVERYFIDREGGCVMGNLALEIGTGIPEFAARIRTYFDEWRAALAELLQPAYGNEKASELAEDTVARVQGAIMMMGVDKDPAVLRRASRDTVALLRAADAETKKSDKERMAAA